jgi:hypothetical protein
MPQATRKGSIEYSTLTAVFHSPDCSVGLLRWLGADRIQEDRAESGFVFSQLGDSQECGDDGVSGQNEARPFGREQRCNDSSNYLRVLFVVPVVPPPPKHTGQVEKDAQCLCKLLRVSFIAHSPDTHANQIQQVIKIFVRRPLSVKWSANREDGRGVPNGVGSRVPQRFTRLFYGLNHFIGKLGDFDA